MNKGYTINEVEQPEKEAWGVIGRGLRAFNIEHAGDDGFQRICFSLSNASGDTLGGALGEVYWGWLHLDLLWIEDRLRGQGFGAQLLSRVEEEARKRGAQHAYLDTFSFQTPDFYRKHGYEVFGELPDFPPGHRRFFMTKRLAGER